MKKNLIIVSSLFNLILAIQVRNSLFREDDFDVVLTDKSAGLSEIFQARSLERIFNKVYFANTEKLSGKAARLARLRGIFSPEKLFSAMTDEKLPGDYTDIFFWNPDMIFYSVYMDYQKKDKELKLHLYGDTAGGYMVEEPYEKFPFPFWYYKSVLVRSYLVKKYSLKMISEMDYDYYLFSPELGLNTGKRVYRAVPCIKQDEETKCLFNNVFSGESINIDNYRYIIFDRPISEINIDIIKYEKAISTIVNKVGSGNIVVKKHPRSSDNDINVYIKNGINVITDTLPWEIYCLNHEVADKVFVTISSSAVFLPSILFGKKNSTIMLYRLIELNAPETTDFYDKIEGEFYIPNNMEEMKTMLERIEGK